MRTEKAHPKWMSAWLKAAGVYNIIWGAVTVLYPNWLFDLTGMEPPAYPFIWQCVGMIVGVYGLGYWIAASDPFRHWPIVLVGFLGKIFGPMGYVGGVLFGGTALANTPFIAEIPPQFGWTLLTNDLVWWIPFALMLAGALKHNTRGDEAEAVDVKAAIETTVTASGQDLAALTRESSVLLVFLRHSGCTFCKEALADLAKKASDFERAGVVPVFVHMSERGRAAAWLAKHGFEGAHHVSDPEKRLYRSFELVRGSWSQLFGLRVWIRGFIATLNGHLVGKLDGDGFQMPGVFLLRDGEVVKAYRHLTAADRPDYTAIACGVPA